MQILSRLKSHRFLFSVLALILCLGAGFFAYQKIIAPGEGHLTEPLKRGVILEAVYGIGTVEAAKSFELRPGTTNYITKLYVHEGDEVKTGDPLMMLGSQRITSPFDGVVTALPFKEKESVFPNTLVLSVTNLQERYMNVSLEQEGALRVKRGQKVKLSFESLREKSYEGVVDSVYSQGQDFIARIDLDQLPPVILPGMTADVAIAIRELENVLVIPVRAIDGGFVYIKDGLRKKKIAVRLGVVDGLKAQVLEGGIKEGDRLIVHQEPVGDE